MEDPCALLHGHGQRPQQLRGKKSCRSPFLSDSCLLKAMLRRGHGFLFPSCTESGEIYTSWYSRSRQKIAPTSPPLSPLLLCSYLAMLESLLLSNLTFTAFSSRVLNREKNLNLYFTPSHPYSPKLQS
jgi:hypothetical protein